MEISRKCPKKAQKASTLPRHLCPVGANGAMTKRHETVGAAAKRPPHSMPLGTLQDMGKALTRSFDHRVTHGGHGKTAKAAKEALWAQPAASRPKRRSDRIHSRCTSGMPHAARVSLTPHAGIDGNA